MAQRLVWLAMAASMLMALTGFLCFVRVPLLPVHGHGFWDHLGAYLARIMVYAVPFAVSLFLLVWAEKQFKTGFQQDRWTEAELAGVRAFLSSKVLRGTWWLLVALWVAALVAQHSTRDAVTWYLLLMPLLTAQRIRQLITPRVESAGLLGWRNFGRVRSEHWGERGA